MSSSQQSDGPSDIWMRKMKTYFRCLDTNQNSYLEKEDCKRLVERFMKYGGALSDEQIGKLKIKMTTWWDQSFKGVEKVAFDEFCKTRYELSKSKSPEDLLENYYKGNLELMFKAINTNNDGVISLPEWKVYHLAMGIEDEKVTTQAFETVNLNKDGKISLDDFVKAAFDFLYNQEDSVYKEFLGPV